MSELKNERQSKRGARLGNVRETAGGCAAVGAIILFVMFIVASFIFGDRAETMLNENSVVQLFGTIIGLFALVWFCLSLPRFIKEYAPKVGSGLILLAIVLALIDVAADVRTGRAISLSGNLLGVFILGIIILGIDFILEYRDCKRNNDGAFDKVREVSVCLADEDQDCILIVNNAFDTLDDIIVTFFAPTKFQSGATVTQGEHADKDSRIKVEHVERGKFLVKIPNSIANDQRFTPLLKLTGITGLTSAEIAFSAEGRYWIKRGGSRGVVTEIHVTPSEYYGSENVPEAWTEAKRI